MLRYDRYILYTANPNVQQRVRSARAQLRADGYTYDDDRQDEERQVCHKEATGAVIELNNGRVAILNRDIPDVFTVPYHGKHEAYRAPVMRPPVLEIIECVCYVIVAIVAGGGSGTAKRTQKKLYQNRLC